MKKLDDSIKLYSLGLEELAMALGLINRPDMGRQLIASIYDNLNDAQIESRLSSASHSLLARGLAAISGKGSPILESGLEQALFPLVRFDYVLQLSRVRGDDQVGATVHVQKGKSFTSHSIQAGVVHVLEHGLCKNLSAYLRDTFNLGVEKNATSVEHEWTITPGVLGEALRGADPSVIFSILSNAGVPNNDAKNLADDLAHQTLRGTILRVQANSDADMDQLVSLDKRMLMILGGRKRGWLFEFESTVDETPGKAYTINNSVFQKRIETFAL